MEKQHKNFELIVNLVAKSAKRDTLQSIISNKSQPDKAQRKDPLGNFVIRSIQETILDEIETGVKETQSNKNSDQS